MREPTVWAVTDPQGRGVAIAADAGDAIYRAERTGEVPGSVMQDLWRVFENGTRRDAFTHAGYRVAPMALVAPEALAVVEAAVAWRIDGPEGDTADLWIAADDYARQSWPCPVCDGTKVVFDGEEEDNCHACGGVGYDRAAYRAATARTVSTVRDCDYWKPIRAGSIALPCNCGMGCDGPRAATARDAGSAAHP